MKKNMTMLIGLALSISVLFVGCSTTDGQGDTTTGTSAEQTTVTTSATGLVEKTYDKDQEDSGDFNDLFGTTTASGSATKKKASVDNTAEEETEETSGFSVSEDTEGQQYGEWF